MKLTNNRAAHWRAAAAATAALAMLAAGAAARAQPNSKDAGPPPVSDPAHTDTVQPDPGQTDSGQTDSGQADTVQPAASIEAQPALYAGRAPYICSPSGFGARSKCFLRSSLKGRSR